MTRLTLATSTRRDLLAAVPWLVAAPALAAAAEGPATTPAALSKDQQKIKDLGAYYAKLYSEPLQSTERLPRQIAIISLSRIDHPSTTQKLLEVFKLRDKDPVIGYLAWEALHARHASLSAEERRGWLTGGLQAAAAGGFPGTTITPLLMALSELHPTAFEDLPHKVALRVIQENSLDDPQEKKTLEALRRLVKIWTEPSLVRVLVVQMNRPQVAERIDFVLRGLPNPPAAGEPKKLAAPWNGWLASAKLQVAAQGSLPTYSGQASVFPKPPKITDPNDKRWYAELEMGKLTVSDFDLVWAIDSTGSMNDENQMIAAQTGHVIRICSLVSRRTRCGAVYARHEIEKRFMQRCCEAAAANRNFYQVKGHPLTADIKELAQKMANERIPKPDPQGEGNVHPGTPVLGALQGAVQKMKWSNDKNARRVIVMVGDSKRTPGTEKAAEQFAAECKKQGYFVHALAQRQAMSDWADVFKASGGVMMPFGAGAAAQQRPNRPRADRGDRMGGDGEASPRTVFDQIATRIIRSLVAEGYHDRVDPLVAILADYARSLGDAEKRIAELAR